MNIIKQILIFFVFIVYFLCSETVSNAHAEICMSFDDNFSILYILSSQSLSKVTISKQQTLGITLKSQSNINNYNNEQAHYFFIIRQAYKMLHTIKKIHHIEEEAMLPLHSYTIKAGGYSFSIHTNGITIVATHTPTVWKAVTHRLYSHINMMLCMVCFIFLAVVYCYERFYYRQREAYPPCGHVSLLQELSHKKIKNIYSFSLLIRNSNHILLCSITHYITSKQKHCEHTRSLLNTSITTSLSLHKLEVLPWYV